VTKKRKGEISRTSVRLIFTTTREATESGGLRLPGASEKRRKNSERKQRRGEACVTFGFRYHSALLSASGGEGMVEEQEAHVGGKGYHHCAGNSVRKREIKNRRPRATSKVSGSATEKP